MRGFYLILYISEFQQQKKYNCKRYPPEWKTKQSGIHLNTFLKQAVKSFCRLAMQISNKVDSNSNKVGSWIRIIRSINDTPWR